MKAILWFSAILVLFSMIVGYELSYFRIADKAGEVRAPLYTVDLAGAQVQVELAQTKAERERGLGGRESLPKGQGMLFVFEKDDRYAFWMKNVSFPIDIIWLSNTGSVVYIASNVSPDTYPMTYVSKDPARYVLEVPAGFVNRYGVQIGDTARLP